MCGTLSTINSTPCIPSIGRRDGRGVYIVLWFGNVPRKNVPKHPDGLPRPKTPGELERMLRDRLPEARRSSIDIFVIDLSRPACTAWIRRSGAHYISISIPRDPRDLSGSAVCSHSGAFSRSDSRPLSGAPSWVRPRVLPMRPGVAQQGRQFRGVARGGPVPCGATTPR